VTPDRGPARAMPISVLDQPRPRAGRLDAAAPERPVARPARRNRLRFMGDLWFLLPALAVYGLVLVYPMLAGIRYSLTDWNGLDPNFHYVGLANFIRLAGDLQVRSAISTTLIIAAAMVVLQNGLGLLLALALNRKLRGSNFLRVLFFFPVVLTPVVVSFVWQYLLSSLGPVNQILVAIGLPSMNWLGNPDLALCSIIALALWQNVGLSMVILLAGLQAVPAELIEAARIDGARPVQRLRYVTLPMLAPAITITVVLSLIHGLKLFDQIYVLTGGGPGYATETLSTIIYKTSFQFAENGYGSAIALVFAILVSALVLVATHMLRGREIGDA
jgi:raffinose/stachyose/melibiose transport system permease protein